MVPRSVRSAGFTLIELLVVIAIIAVLIGLLLPAIQKVREAGNRAQCLNHMKQLGLAMHTYRDQASTFPPGWVSGQHNYVQFILPYIEQQALAQMYNFAGAWSAAVNKAAVETEIPTLICPSVPVTERKWACDYPISESISTPASTALGLGSLPIQRRQGFFVTSNVPVRVEDVSDGLSQTMMIFEDAGRPIYFKGGLRKPAGGALIGNHRWADPENRITIQVSSCGGWPVINCDNANEIYSMHNGGANFCFGDGNARFIAQNIARPLFAALYTRGGGETVGDDY